MMNPRYSLYTLDKTSPRGFGWVWFLRPAQALVSLIILGLTAVNISGLNNASGITCSIPGKMAWNLACAVLSLIVLAYLLLSSGTVRIFRVLPWWIFIQLGLDALMCIFWIAAASTSHFNCDDLCSACNASSVSYDHLSCSCSVYSGYVYSDYFWKKRGISPNPNPGLSGGLAKRITSRSAKRTSGILIAREALDAIMCVLFFITLCATEWWMWQNRQAGDTAAPAATGSNPENGAQQVPVEMKHKNAYNNGAPEQGDIYHSGAPQQQGSFAPVSPVNQYPPQPQQQAYPHQPPQSYQGYPQQGYQPQQQQGYPPQQAYPEQQQQPPVAYYGGPEGQQQPRKVTPQQHDIPNYPTPTPEMQGEHKTTQ